MQPVADRSLKLIPRGSRSGRPAVWVGTALTVGLLWLTEIPLGVPGEWTWSRIAPATGEWPDLLLGIATGAVVLGAYVAGVLFVGRRIEPMGRPALGLALAGLAAAGFLVLWIVQESPPGVHRLQKAPMVLYYPGTSGYFHHATFRVDSPRDFLRGYERWTREGDVLHLGTHPPGLFLLHTGLTRTCERLPALARAVRATEPASVRQAFDEILRPFPAAPRPLSVAEEASLWLAALITQAVAAATVVPLYLLIRRGCSRRTSWNTAALWPLVPAVGIFLPKSDALYPAIGCLLIWCWTEASRRRSMVFGAAAGLVAFGSLFLSLAFLPVGLLAAALGARESLRAAGAAGPGGDPRNTIRAAILATLPALAGAMVAFAVPLVLFGTLSELNLPAVWAQNLRNHAAFYDRFPRTGWKWQLANPIELTLATGWPAMFAAMRLFAPATFRTVRQRGLAPTAVAIAAVIGLLWLSGKNSGEAARLWLFLIPWILWLAGLSQECRRSPPAEQSNPPHVGPTPSDDATGTLLLAQATVCLATITRVTGFTFGAE